MTTQLSKADRIRKILHLSNAEIAERIGCRTEYVRAVRQRTSVFGNPVEPDCSKNWKLANREFLRSYRRTYMRCYWQNNRERLNAYRRNRRAEARAS